MAHVLLVFPRPNRIEFDTTYTINLGLAHMAACLEARGHSVTVHDCNADPDQALAPRLRGVDVVGMYTLTSAVKAATRLAERVKREWAPHVKIVLGGPHPSARPAETLACEAVDYVVVGEGEVLLCELVEALPSPESRGLPGLYWRDGSGAVHGKGKATPPPDLDALPFPAYHLFPRDRFLPTRPTWIDAGSVRCGSLMTSRGCPYRCSFCTSAVGSPFAKRFRAMSPERTVEHIEWLKRDYGVTFVEFQDDVFNLDVARANRICELLIARKVGVAWSIPNGISRVENITEEFMRLCKRSGCVDAWFAAESGSARIRDEVIGKGNTLTEVRAAIEASHRVGLTTGAFFVLGSPDETEEEMEATIELACSLPLDRAQFTLATPFPGTALWDRIDREGTWLERDYDAFGPYENVVYFEHGRMKRDVLLRMYKRAFRRFYFRPSYLVKRVALRKETYTNLPLIAREAVRFMW